MPLQFFDHLFQLRYVERKYASGVQVFARDASVTSFYSVKSGEVHLQRAQENGAEFILQRAYQGSVLAEASVHTDHYHCDAVAVIPTVLYAYSRSDVRRLINANPEVSAAYVVHMAREVRHARLQAEIMSLRRVRDRLDAWLVWHDGVLPDKGEWQQVAHEIGVSPEALYRELAKRR